MTRAYASKESFAKLFADQLGAIPFADTGPERVVSWRALGITWRVRFGNDYQTTRAGERFCALAQILLADFADVELALLPTEVSINLRTAEASSSADALPSNEGRAWEVSVPRELDSKDVGRGIAQTVAVIAQVLLETSLLPLADANKRIEDAYKAGLVGKLTPNTSYDRVFSEFITDEKFNSSARAVRAPIRLTRLPQLEEHKEVAWRSEPGPTYSNERATEYVRTRYRRSPETIRFALPRLLATKTGRDMVQALRGEGWSDWRILGAFASVAMSWRVNRLDPNTPDERRDLSRKYMGPEPVDEQMVPLTEFTRPGIDFTDQSNLLSSLLVWDLDLRQRTPDFPAIRRFMNVRYRHDKDDVEHEDPFKGSMMAATDE